MTKSLNQYLYSSIVYGSADISQKLRLESTSNVTKGQVEVVGTYLDLIINSRIGRLIHANSATRTYTFPDYSGTVLISGILSQAGDIIYASSPGIFAVLHPSINSALTTDSSGLPSWAQGTSGQFLQVNSSNVVTFADLPSNIGTISDSTAGNTFPIYSGPGNDLIPLTTINSRALLSSAIGVLTWSLITAPYLQGNGVALTNGSTGQVLASRGDGSFQWVEQNSSIIHTGISNRLSFYSALTELSASSFLEVDETTRTLNFFNASKLRLYEATVNGTQYVEFRAPISLSSSTIFTVPTADGVAGSFLTTDGAGNLSFVYVDNGSVASGSQYQLGFYAANGNDISGLSTISNRVLTSPSGILTWALITAPYLSTIGGASLGNGLLNQVLCSDANGNFTWQTATSLTGQVGTGQVNQIAYYPSTGTLVQGSSFVETDNSSKILSIKGNGSLKIYHDSNYISLTSASLSSSLSFVLPPTDGSFEQVLATNSSGGLSFITVGRGIVHTGTSGYLSFYQANTNEVYPFPVTDSRALLSSSSLPGWGLITEKYVSTSGGLPLGGGTSGQLMTSDGLGNFVYQDASSLIGTINTGASGRLAFYPIAGKVIDDSSYLNSNEPAKAFELLSNGILRLYDSANYVGIKAPTLSSNLVLTLPSLDGTIGMVLTTDGSGSLSFEQRGKINPGVINALAIYSASQEVEDSYLLAPIGLPSTDGEALISTTSGQLSFAQLIETGGSIGEIAYYKGGQNVGHTGIITINTLNGSLNLNNQTGINFLTNGPNYVGFYSPSGLVASYDLILPPTPPTVGQILTASASNSLTFSTPGENRQIEQSGYIDLIKDIDEVTILFDTPYDSIPQVVNVQWSIEGSDDMALLPTYGIRDKTKEGFRVKFSAAIPDLGTYRMYWATKKTGENPTLLRGLIAGGTDIGGIKNSLLKLLLDLDTSLFTSVTFGTSRTKTAATASSTKGYVHGGTADNATNLLVTTAYTYATDTLADIASACSPRVQGTGVGDRTNGYTCGGYDIGLATQIHSIEKIVHGTETFSTLAASLSNDSTARGGCTSESSGYIVNSSSNGTIEILNYTTEGISLSPVNFGVDNVQQGCNNVKGGLGYFGKDDGTLFSYNFSTDTITTLAATLTSTLGLSSSFNSLAKGYFTGDTLIEALDFSTEATSSVNVLPTANNAANTASTFQSMGLL